MISTGQSGHQQAVDISSVNVIPCPYKPLAVEIPTTAQPLHTGGKRVGPACPSVQSQIRPALP